MATEMLEQAIGTTRGVLLNISKEQLDDDTPCAQWKVRDLVNHIVGGQYFFEAGVAGQPPAGGDANFAERDFVAAFDEGARRCVAAFSADGVMDKVLTLPFGQMPGSAFIGLATTDTFVHGWDLAKATGQNTDLAPELAAELLVRGQQAVPPELRSEDGAIFGPEQPAPADASNADKLAAFLGRKV